jgi:hypothetical protein
LASPPSAAGQSGEEIAATVALQKELLDLMSDDENSSAAGSDSGRSSKDNNAALSRRGSIEAEEVLRVTEEAISSACNGDALINSLGVVGQQPPRDGTTTSPSNRSSPASLGSSSAAQTSSFNRSPPPPAPQTISAKRAKLVESLLSGVKFVQSQPDGVHRLHLVVRCPASFLAREHCVSAITEVLEVVTEEACHDPHKIPAVGLGDASDSSQTTFSVEIKELSESMRQQVEQQRQSTATTATGPHPPQSAAAAAAAAAADPEGTRTQIHQISAAARPFSAQHNNANGNGGINGSSRGSATRHSYYAPTAQQQQHHHHRAPFIQHNTMYSTNSNVSRGAHFSRRHSIRCPVQHRTKVPLTTASELL